MATTGKQESVADAHIEKHNFECDVNQVLDLMIKSVYSKNEYFLRELISNASDACDKFKALYSTLRDEGCDLNDAVSLRIEIIPDLATKTLIIKDNGIGMTKADLINFVGTIASSGTRKFREAMANKEANVDAGHLIGQFGLGFYSAYLVAERVDVITKHPRDEAFVWSSTGKDEYTIEDYQGEPFLHGTTLVLHIKEGMEEFLDSKKLTEIIKKHSAFIVYPIIAYVEKEVEEEVEKETKEEEKGEDKVEEVKEETAEVKVEEVKEKVKKTKIVQERVNSEKPIWSRGIKDCSDEELKSFYKTISKDWDDYLAVDYWHIEGFISIKLLMFIPKRAGFNFFNKQKKANNIKLYCSNVFVTDDLGDAIPEWMSFVHGVIASDDISMNISRELIQGSNVMKLIKKTLPQKIMEMIIKLSKDAEKFKDFYKEFGNCLKMAVGEANGTEQEKYAKVLRYYTTKSGEEMVSLDQYVERMHPQQTQIYIITGLGKESVIHSPFLSAFEKYEVIYMYDVMDEVMLRSFKTYKGKNIQRITAEGVELPEQEDTTELVSSFEPFCNKVKEVLTSKVEKVNINPRLAKTIPAVITTTKYSLSSAMENIMRSQPVAEANPFAAMTAQSKKIFEVNPNHQIIINLKNIQESGDEDLLKRHLEILYETVLINSGFVLNDPHSFCTNVFNFLAEKEEQKKI